MMRVIRIDPADFSNRRKFIRFPFDLYQNCDLWVPPLASEMTTVMNRNKHPFYQHSEADFFIAEQDGQVAGRIAVLHNRNYCQHHQVSTAFFYYFDCIDDVRVSNALFEAAFEWARKRNLNTVIGPRGFLRSSGIGLLVEGFDMLPAIGIAYNYPYYDSLLAAAGFTKETDYFSGRLYAATTHPDSRIYEVADKVKARGKFSIKTFRNRAELRRQISSVNKVHHDAFHQNPGYYPTTEAEFEMIANSMIQLADPRMIKLIMREDQIVGFCISYPDISRALQKTGGRLFPFGWITLLREVKRTRVVDLNGLGFLPQYQGMGGNALLYVEIEKTLRDFHFDMGELVQVDERNFKSKSDMESIGVQWCKRHRLYRKTISARE